MNTQPQSQSHKKRLLGIIGVVLGLVLLGTAAIMFFAQSNSIKSGRRQFYVVSGGLGGRCSYYLADNKGKRQSTCVDTKRATWPLPEVEVDPTQELGAGTTSAVAVRVVRVDANVTVVTEQRSVPLPKPEYKKTRVIYIDDVFSADIVTLP